MGLLDATAVERAGSPAGPGTLRAGMQVVIDGELSGQAMIARRIEILSRDSPSRFVTAESRCHQERFSNTRTVLPRCSSMWASRQPLVQRSFSVFVRAFTLRARLFTSTW